MNKKILFERGAWSLSSESEPPPEFVELLVRTIWGTPGKTLYQHLDTRERITQLKEPYFLTLKRDGRPIAGITLCRRSVREGDQSADAFYIRYFSFLEALRNQGAGTVQPKGDRNVKLRSQSLLKHQLTALFSKPELLTPRLADHPHALYYAFVESENQRSLQINTAFRLEQVRSFRTLPFSRFFPEKDEGVRLIKASEHDEVRHAVERQYQHYRLFFTDHLFHGDHYYVLKRAGKIVAGLRAMPVHWVINHLPGLSGKLIMKLVPHLPLLSRLFNPKDFTFIAVEGLFFLPGHEREIFLLLESVLAETGSHTAMLWLDDQSELYRFFLHSGRLGLLHQLEKPSPVNVMVRFVDHAPEAIEAYRNAPVYISALDVT